MSLAPSTTAAAPESASAARDEEPHWISQSAFLFVSGLLACCQLLMWWLLHQRHYGWAVPLALVMSHLMHGQLIGFHEASHGLLRKNRTLNEIDGVLIGTLSFMSFSLYRAAHQTHHMHLSSPRDEEFWPFVDPSSSRGWRIVAATLELSFGIFFTPAIFLRTFLREGSPIRSKKVRRRVWAEFALMAVVWPAVLGIVAWQGWWNYLLGMYFIPGWIAGNLQSWRKYIEHVGMTGSTPNGSTRSIVADTTLGRLFSFTLLHEPLHGVHHQHAGLRHAYLSRHTQSLQPTRADERPPFPSYRHALIDLFRSLSNPRVGAHWVR